VSVRRIERFCKTTRWFHWTFVLPFLGLAATGATLGLREPLGLTEEASRALVRLHEGIAILWLLAPPLVLLSGQTRTALADLTLPFRINRDDLRWLALQPLAALGRAALPAAGKLNAGQKVNGLMAVAVSFGLAASGIWLWRRPGALVPWISHLVLFAVWLPAFVGHFYLAVLNPGTRHALRAMFAGDVDLDWARHHHPLWVEEETGAEPSRLPSHREPAPKVPARRNVALADEQA
jgi:formate dehydrogenase subunit gamma